MKLSALLAVMLTVTIRAAAAQSGPVRIYIAPDDHTDYMWSGDEEAYRQAFIEMLDYYLDLADATRDNPPEHQSRWNCDGSLWLWTYQRNKPPADFERLIGRIRSGHITVPLNAVASCYGGMPTEAVLRGMYYAGQIERRYGLRFPLVIAMESQTLPYGLGGLWAGAGARYSWKGICRCVMEKMQPAKESPRPHEIYWWQAPDGSRILMKWNSFFGNQSIGGYAEAYHPSKVIELVTSDKRFATLYPYRVIGVFGQGEDHLKILNDDILKAARAATTAERKVIVSSEVDFFEDFEKTYGASLPVFSAGLGNNWDLYPASLAEVSARVRRSVEKLRAAEALATLVSLAWPGFLGGREQARDQAMMDLGLYWEHDWTADGRIITQQARAAWQRKLAGRIESYVDSLAADAAFALGGLIRKQGSHPRFYVFNPLGWTRSDAAGLSYDGPKPVHVIDLETGAEVPSQWIASPGELKIFARDVPPAGYRVYEVRPGAGGTFSSAASVFGNVLENAFYRIRVEDRGAITSLIDKTRGNRELGRMVDERWINDLGLGSGILAVEDTGPVSVTLRASGSTPLAHTTRITLTLDSRRIGISNEITQNFGGVHTWSFGFNLNAPDTWHEEIGAVARAKLTTAGGHYYPTHSRLDWLSLNHFAAMTGADGVGITLSSADCSFMKLGASAQVDGIARLDTATPQISVLAGGQVDGPGTGIPNQGGDSRFLQRFALQSHGAFSAAESMRFALEHQNPLVTGRVRGGGPYPEKSFSLVTISDPDVLLWSLKPAEEGISKGVIARVWNVASEPKQFSLRLQPGISAARRATHIETDLGPAPITGGALSVSIGRAQLLTFRLVR